MKKILIVHTSLEIGGAETSLIDLLKTFDYSRVQADLFLYDQTGPLLSLIPKEVNVLPEIPQYKAMVLPIKKSLKEGHFAIAFTRAINKITCKIQNKRHRYSDFGYVQKQLAHKKCLSFLPDINDKDYDLAISFIDPHFIAKYKAHANTVAGWLHTDFSRITPIESVDHDMWDNCNYIVCVSEECREGFVDQYPDLKEKTIVIENVLSSDRINEESLNEKLADGLFERPYINLLSIGRFSAQKNFDNVPDICRRILDKGLKVKWYLLGYGTDEELIKQKIAECHMEDSVIILGKKTNPYPYIKACDYYVQPSRYEGKAVTVREAQMLGKPVIITDYVTSRSQLTDGYDGVIVPLDNKACAEAIYSIIQNKELTERLIENCRKNDYSNRQEIEKIYDLLEG